MDNDTTTPSPSSSPTTDTAPSQSNWRFLKKLATAAAFVAIGVAASAYRRR